MKLSKFNFVSLAGFFILAIVLPFCLRAEESNYSECASINDFLSYSKCVAEIDSKKTGQTTQTLVEPVKAEEADFSIKINNGTGKTNSLDIIVNLTASTSTAKISISKDSNFGFAERQDYSLKKIWRLEDLPDETQYVYVKFFDANDTELKVLSASVVYSPRKTDAAAEAAAKVKFAKIYGKKFNDQTQFDNYWLELAVYGIDKSFERDLNKEKTAINKFKAVYKKAPSAAEDWLIVNAIAYAPLASTSSAATPAAATTGTVANESGSCVATAIKQVLDVGSKGSEVKGLQDVLKCSGYLSEDFKVNSVFDNKTEEAVKKFQEKYSLACKDGKYCGRVGPATAKKIMEVFKAGNQETASVSTETPTVATAVKTKLKLSRNLTIGMQGADVKALQEFLAADSELYPEGKITSKFDEATENAIKKFQEKYSLACKDTTYCGYVGPATRTKLQEVSAE